MMKPDVPHGRFPKSVGFNLHIHPKRAGNSVATLDTCHCLMASHDVSFFFFNLTHFLKRKPVRSGGKKI